MKNAKFEARDIRYESTGRVTYKQAVRVKQIVDDYFFIRDSGPTEKEALQEYFNQLQELIERPKYGLSDMDKLLIMNTAKYFVFTGKQYNNGSQVGYYAQTALPYTSSLIGVKWRRMFSIKSAVNGSMYLIHRFDEYNEKK